MTIITGEELSKGHVNNLADALRGVPGVATTGIADGQNITIRGLPGEYTLILVDGKRQNMRESRTNGSGGIEQYYMPPVSAIDRIEVVRGPMSSLYGSDAMGGVINIITKPVAESWSGELTLENTAPQSGEDSESRQASLYLSGPIVNDQFGLQLWSRGFDRSESGRDSGPGEREVLDVKSRLTWAPSIDHELRFELGRTEIKDPDETSTRRNKRDSWSLGYLGQWDNVESDLSLTRERGGRRTKGSERRPEVTNSVAEAKFATPFVSEYGDHVLVTGAQAQRSELTDQNPGRATDDPASFSADQWALYAEDEWSVLPDVRLTLGARHTQHEFFGGHVSPRAYAVWDATQKITVKGGVSAGYRTPELRQIAPDYYLTTERGRGVIASNPDLEPEESLSSEIGAIYDGGSYYLGATFFHTSFENKLEDRKTDGNISVDGTSYNLWEYYNVGEAEIRGVELTGTVDVSNDLRLTASYSYTDSEQITGDYKGLPLTRTPEHQASLRGDWTTPVQNLTAWAALLYHGEEINAGERIGSNGSAYATNADGDVIAYKYDSYVTMDAGLGYRINDNFRLNAALYNLLDEDVNSTDHNTVLSGRSLWLSLTTSF